MKIIDVSIHNTREDYDGAEFDGMMIRTGYATHLDCTFVRNVVDYCIFNHKHYGFYFYTYALTEGELEEELNVHLSFIHTLSNEYGSPLLPVAIDVEDADGKRRLCSSIFNYELIDKACRSIEQEGFYAMFYTGNYYLTTKISRYADLMKRFDSWIASWDKKPQLSCGLWQFTNQYQGRHLDCSYTDKDYPAIIHGMYQSVENDETEEENYDTKIRVGDTVRIRVPIDYYGTQLAGFTMKELYNVYEIRANRAVLAKGSSIMCAIELEKLEKIVSVTDERKNSGC